MARKKANEKLKDEKQRLKGELKREKCISVRLNKEELERLEQQRGKFKMGEWLRRSWLKTTPPSIPALNAEAWADLGRATGNLNQITKKLNLNEKGKEVMEELNTTIKELRQALIGVKKGADNERDA